MTDYKVKNIKLADWGRKEINIAETEMPGLMSLRKKYGKKNAIRFAWGYGGAQYTGRRLHYCSCGCGAFAGLGGLG